MTQTYNGPKLPVYQIAITIPRVPIDSAMPIKRPPAATRIAAPTFLKPSLAINETRESYDHYLQMCEGLQYLEAKASEPFPQ